ncbi:MAG: hypothetical protein HFJ27_03145 [Clostridia bacterium]|nr:hypothetical protein [Clostridia bacterium]
MKKNYIYIGIGILVAIILVLSGLFFLLKHPKITYSPIIASDGSFQINFPSSITYQMNQKENNEFILDLYSAKDEMFLYATKIAKSRQIDLLQIANNDKANYQKDKANVREASEVISSNVQNYKVYEYHFVYTDSSYGKDFYSNVVWFETNSYLYVLNFEVVKENIDKFQDIFLNIKNSFIEL